MPARGPVSMRWQTAFCFIPVMDIVASYRVMRLRRYLAIFLAFAVASSALQAYAYPFDDPETYDRMVYSEERGFDWEYAILGPDPGLGVQVILLQHAAAYVLAVFFIRRWSRAWNLGFA